MMVDDNVEIDINEILRVMSEQNAKQAQEIAVLTATISAMQKKQVEQKEIKSEESST